VAAEAPPAAEEVTAATPSVAHPAARLTAHSAADPTAAADFRTAALAATTKQPPQRKVARTRAHARALSELRDKDATAGGGYSARPVGKRLARCAREGKNAALVAPGSAPAESPENGGSSPRC
jgi:hypothetical protein